ncbi:MAG: PQQ-binding-like beta-propeller repeat protein, partial [Planctomycetaceae bacterium]
LICTPGGPDAELVALDKRTGAVVWQTKFPTVGPAGRDGAAFASCVPSQGGGVRQFVQLHGRGLVGVAADDGRLLWSYNAICNSTANIPTPVVHGDWVFAANGYNAGSVLLRLSPDPDSPPGQPGVRATEVYTLAGGVFQNHHGGVVRLGDRVFGGHGSNNGLPTCLDLTTGTVLWKKRGPSTGSAAVVAVGQQLCFRYQTGLVALLTPNPAGFQIDGTLQIPGAGEDSWAHPVVAGGMLYLREQETLFAHDLREESRQPGNPRTSRDPAPPPDREVTALDAGGWQARRLADDSHAGLAGLSATDRWLQFARRPTDKDSPVVCRLREAQQTPAGQLTAVAANALRAARGPLVLDLQGLRVTPELLASLVALPNVVGLDLQLCDNLDGGALDAVARGTGLRVVGLAGTAVSGAELVRLRDLPELVALDLEGCDR